MGLNSLNSITIIGTCQGTDGAGQLEHVGTRGTRRSWKVRCGLLGPLASEQNPGPVAQWKSWKSNHGRAWIHSEKDIIYYSRAMMTFP